MPKTYTVKQVADLFNTNPETVRRWIRTGKLIAEKDSNKTGNVILESSLNAFVKTMPKYSGLLATSLLPTTLVTAAALTAGGIALSKYEENKKINDSKIDIESIKDLLKSQIDVQKKTIVQKEKSIEQIKNEIKHSETIIKNLTNLLLELDDQEEF